ncbi:unnamed protein product [Mycena citricolor]|uniref:AMP-dependent synthetase/ligase domain-containing protein n=1 Tax=Mycena citricolor TaxID=2018698 RepID=A0AAD2K0X1_9AGAR|nr:unnamed protein product [Mycena citricolor]
MREWAEHESAWGAASEAPEDRVHRASCNQTQARLMYSQCISWRSHCADRAPATPTDRLSATGSTNKTEVMGVWEQGVGWASEQSGCAQVRSDQNNSSMRSSRRNGGRGWSAGAMWTSRSAAEFLRRLGFYGQSLEQCAKLSTGKPLFDLCNLHRKWLQIYAEEVLTAGLKRPSYPQQPRQSTESHYEPNELRQSALIINLLEGAYSVSLGVIYDPSMFDQKLIASLKADFEQIVAQAMAETSFDLKPLLGNHIPCPLPSVNASDVDKVSKRRFHVIFKHQAARNPDGLAMTCAEREESMTYGELNERANQMANALCQLGMQHTHVVLLRLRRGFSTLCWILAFLKAGATYAIADQGHPLKRMRSAMTVAEPDLVGDDGMGIEVGLFSGTLKILRTQTCALDVFPKENLNEVSQDDVLA